MPTIVFCSPKGGAGKTTSSLLFATQIAKQGKEVTFIDADPNLPVKAWSEGGHVPDKMTIVSDVTEETIEEAIAEASTKTPFVVVDLEGTASKIVVYAVAAADFVVIPTQGSQLDARQAARAIKLVRSHERTIQRHKPSYKLPYGIVFTRTSVAIDSRETKNIRAAFSEMKIPFFETELHERAAFKAMFSFNRPLDALKEGEVSNVPQAIENAEKFTAEVIERFRAAKAEEQQNERAA
jgi:chromosome partitioning protein